ncbi:MAG: glycosyltransferase family 4 protein [Vampirovibrionales bacterium]|nr:glycosyltransferase family 4 protein [Vampirovibrionales bacterium]
MSVYQNIDNNEAFNLLFPDQTADDSLSSAAVSENRPGAGNNKLDEKLPPQTQAQYPARKVKIGFILDAPFPADTPQSNRAEREATALVLAGYEVHLLCLWADNGITPERPSREEYYRGIYIHRVLPADVKYALPFFKIQTRLPYQGLLKAAADFFLNRDTAWYALIDRFIRFYGLDILQVQGLRLLDTALSAAKKRTTPIVSDLSRHEPAWMELSREKQSPLLARRARNKWEAIERRGLRKAARVLIASEEAHERLLAKCVEEDISAKKLAIVPDAPDIEKFAQMPFSGDINRQFKSWFLISAAGDFERNDEGLQTILEALSILKPEIPELFFVAAGPVDAAYRRELEVLIDRHGLNHRVHLSGKLSPEDIAQYIEASDLCIMPQLANDYRDHTLCENAYVYHLIKKPIIASDCKAAERYIKQTIGGLIYPSGNAEELANQIRRLYYDTDLKKLMGENGLQAVLNQYNWQICSASLIHAYESLVSEHISI